MMIMMVMIVIIVEMTVIIVEVVAVVVALPARDGASVGLGLGGSMHNGHVRPP